MNINIYAGTVINNPESQAFYIRNQLVQPSSQKIASASQADQQVRELLAKATLGAGAAAVATAIPPALSFCLSNPVACNRIVIAGGEIAAGDALGPAGLAVGTIAGVKAVRSAEEVNAAMRVRGWEPAWSPGTPVINTVLQPGTTANMIVDAKTAEAIKDGLPFTPGGWATFNDVSSLAVDMRQRAAITNQFKPNGDGPFYVVKIEITQPVSSSIGFAGKQTETTGNLLRGGGTQIQFDEMIKSVDRNTFLKVISEPKLLK